MTFRIRQHLQFSKIQRLRRILHDSTIKGVIDVKLNELTPKFVINLKETSSFIRPQWTNSHTISFRKQVYDIQIFHIII